MRLLPLALVFTIGCTARYVKVDTAGTRVGYIEHIQAYNLAVQQIRASLDIKAYGVVGSFLHEQADVIVQAPHYMYWSLRSFFGPPSMVFASNGQFLTLYDFSGHSPETYQKIALKHDSFFELLDFRFHPQSLIDILLAKVPLRNESSMSVSEDRLLIVTELEHGWTTSCIFDHHQNQLLETTIKNHELGVSYQAKYDNFETGRMSFPRSIVLLAKGKSRFLRLHVEYVKLELNGDQVLPDIFYLEPH